MIGVKAEVETCFTVIKASRFLLQRQRVPPIA